MLILPVAAAAAVAAVVSMLVVVVSVVVVNLVAIHLQHPLRPCLPLRLRLHKGLLELIAYGPEDLWWSMSRLYLDSA